MIDKILVPEHGHDRKDYTGDDANFLRDTYNQSPPVTNIRADTVSFIIPQPDHISLIISVFSLDDCITHVKILSRPTYDKLMEMFQDPKMRDPKTKPKRRGKKRDA